MISLNEKDLPLFPQFMGALVGSALLKYGLRL
jgi:hypothetical protein